MSDELTLTVGGKQISGWDEVRVTRSIERLPNDFTLSLMDYYPGSDGKQLVKPGNACSVKLGEDLVITGYIDRWTPTISKNRHQVRATGRSKSQDLVDCSAVWTNNVISNVTALQLAQKLAQPYEISVSSDVSDLTSVPQFTLNWGESSQEVIDRVTRWAGLLYFDKPDGSVYLTRVGTKKADSGVSLGVNIEDAEFDESMDQRFSEYTGVSMTVAPLTESSGDSGYTSVTLATRNDPEAAKLRYRNHVIMVESTMITAGKAQSCIDWEMNRRYGRSKCLRVRVDSWRTKAGKLWEPNTLIPIELEPFGITDRCWLLTEVTYIKDQRGTAAELVLMPPEAMAVQPYQFYQQLQELSR